ncbi:MAG: helix-turn-helix domain-containing protein [Planctomycetota bacterium]|jgi:DNA-binding transcriptional ArsR family regulator
MAQLAPLEVIDDTDRAAAVLSPLRLRLLEVLQEPDSATGLGRRLKLPRQRVNYHLRELEEAGFLRLVEERRKGNCTERIVQATSRHYLISPEVLGVLGDSPEEAGDRFSSAYLVATAASLIKEVAVLRRRAARAGKRLATLTIQADVRFASAADQAGFAEELGQAVTRLVAKYHDDQAPRGRLYRLMAGVHPVITKSETEAEAECKVQGEAP